MKTTSPVEIDFVNEGFVLFRGIFDQSSLTPLRESVEALRKDHSFGGGLRRAAALSAAIKGFVKNNGTLPCLLDSIGLPDAFLVRSILFDKTPASNWKVAWHQDTKIPIKQKICCEGFTAWSVKDSVLHAQPPASVLYGMRTLRIHLDPTPTDNGALRVVPGSHRNGILAIKQTLEQIDQSVTCECEVGDVLAMSPLLLHASSPSAKASHRRILHLEFANQPLPDPLEWAIE